MWGRHKSRFWLSINTCWMCVQLRWTTVQFIAQTAMHQFESCLLQLAAWTNTLKRTEHNLILLLIYHAVHGTTVQYKSVLHGCIARMYSCAYGTFTSTSQPKRKIVRSATGSTEYTEHGNVGKPTLDLRVLLSASSN